MRKLLMIIPLACMLACSNGHEKASQSVSLTEQDSQFGACVVTLPKVGLAKTTAEAIVFDLVISGPNMADMHFSWYLKNVDTQATISKIPPGDQRLFTGTLTSSASGVTHVGCDTVAITAGKTAYVNLFLRRTGNAVVNVIIEQPATPGITGCYTLGGALDTLSLSGAVLRVYSDSSSAQMFGAIMRNNSTICKINGPQPSISKLATWNISTMFGGMYLLKVTGDLNSFNGRAYRMSDTSTPAGSLTGKKTACDTVITPPPTPKRPMAGCYTFEGNIDTMRLVNSTLQIFSYDTASIQGQIVQNGKIIGKLAGPQPIDNGFLVNWVLSLVSAAGTYTMKVGSDGIGSTYKSIVFREADTTQSIGTVWGQKTVCDTVFPPPQQSCIIDTTGGPSSCKPLSLWTTYATEECIRQGLILNRISPVEACTTQVSQEKLFTTVCFECCKKF